MSGAPVYPELVTGRRDGVAPGRWRVREGSSRRGGASCDLNERVLEVPFGCDETARAVRAHELMHARVSPCGLDWAGLFGDLAPRALECAEELRVNTLLARLGFDVARLRDGTEKVGGRQSAQAGDWGQVVCFLLAVMGTGAERDYLAGVRSGDAAWGPALRAVRRRVAEVLDALPTTSLGATDLGEDGVPRGYALATVALARLITPLMASRVPRGADELRAFRRSLAPGGRRPPTGRFADPVLAPLARRPAALTPRMRRARPATTGTTLRYPGRLLTDSRRRAFAGTARARGGVVVIDQSGSMDLGAERLATLLRARPTPSSWATATGPATSARRPTCGCWPSAARSPRSGRVATSATASTGRRFATRWRDDARASRRCGSPTVRSPTLTTTPTRRSRPSAQARRPPRSPPGARPRRDRRGAATRTARRAPSDWPSSAGWGENSLK